MILKVEPAFEGIRADKFLAETTDFTRSYISRLINEGHVTVNGRTAKASEKLKNGCVIVLDIPEPENLKIPAQNIPIEIAYEDSELLVVNKPQGMVVHPAAGNYTNTLVNALMYHCRDNLSAINGVLRPGIVHRIDKDTSGLLLVAKTNRAHLSLAEQIKQHSLTRCYIALVHGGFKTENGTVDAPIGRSPKDRKKMCVTDKNSKNAVTHYTVLEKLGRYTLVQCRLETGRTHQIRVHMNYIGHPVACDSVYGVKKELLRHNGQLLHAAQVGFVHPVTGKYIEIKSELPIYFKNIIELCRNKFM